MAGAFLELLAEQNSTVYSGLGIRYIPSTREVVIGGTEAVAVQAADFSRPTERCSASSPALRGGAETAIVRMICRVCNEMDE